ncbi:efflux RND transporter periplasmic adaptor subunit [Denitromonas ohlonensis]|uniref:HlyD family efflux transporter periplasmic adaptor subunit n=2 Tax=Denitromonas TaxID=139331 RepID=A0A558EJ76_9RHOO|nr:HlyD family efflux transporter periplasmic adaptor subunit [Denitromonas ohlonensis]TVT49072.1 MAG: HlyD family efflux transporter periplasmic adaptor subunit [Denitromonas halophila]TVO59973.1 HlyD family efflux transporter periplasmic adaptor subunit [Denitromonas ohlonensis]TVO75061.1 HlyD family efflux transporter periplasmic adaptor subunit [Denitromonas ohlonensis]TVT69200.1 MAG: HlyD family efflux transporter periplasmic adaptor subunit [Denitromonas halophila]TVT73372.1 MAG: HlyD fa
MKSKILMLTLFLAATSASWTTFAGEGHSHGDEGPAAANTNGPARQPDGSVFLPKPAQRQIAVRTIVAETGELPRTLALAGRVVMDPNSGGKVQALVAGRLEAGPGGLPASGQTVEKGTVLAYVVPSVDPIERSNQVAQLAELKATRSLAEKRLARLRDLADTVPRKEIEAAESELASLTARAKAVSGGLGNRDALVAPVSGAIASSNAVAGQVVDARELIFEIVDPRRMRVEALAYDTDMTSDIAGASIAVGESRVPLEFIGAARRLREQALPLSFAATGEALERLAVGQPLEVYVQTRSTIAGIRVPAASVLKNPANQTIVWVKTAAERFEPRTVTVAPLDGVTVAVTSGLATGERVATGAATLINQIR